MRKFSAAILIGLGAAGLVLGVNALLTALAPGSGLQPLQAIEMRTYDWRLTHTARPGTARQDIALVEIDEGSLRQIEPLVGRWPWPRVVHSMVIDYLARGPAKVIGYDVNFAGPDVNKEFEFNGSTMSGAQSDKALADSIRQAGNVIALADATYDKELAAIGTVPDAGYRLQAPGIYERASLLAPFPAMAEAASGFGHNLFVIDPDGPLRHMTPFVRTKDRVLPAFGVAVAMRAAGIDSSQVSLDGTSLYIGRSVIPLALRSVKSSEGLETYLWMLVNFRGPALLTDLKSRTYPTYSFVDLLLSEGQLLDKQKPYLDPATFRDKIVFVGATASALFDVFETPFSNGKMPGINVHAAVTDDILSDRFMRPERPGLTISIVVLTALVIGLIATAIPAWWATGITALLVAAYATFATQAFARGYWLNLSQPTLAASFALFGGVGYQYFVEGREKRKMKRLFGQYVSKDVYDQLVSNPTLARLGGHRRQMTVLFSDIRGFTSVSEKGEPEEIVRTLNEYFTQMVDIVFKHKGTVDKFVGDMVMALFGAPVDDVDHAEHAVDAALEMIEELLKLNARWIAEGRPALDIGIGINTGPMIAGNIGSEAIMSYTVIGDAVNLGARLESLNKQYSTRIIISDATRAALPDRYIFRSLGEVVVKGKTRPVAIFEVVGRAPAAEATTGAPGSPVTKEAQL